MKQNEFKVLYPDWQRFAANRLNHNTVHIWCCSIAEHTEYLREGDIPAAEWQQGGRYLKPADQLRFRISRKMLRQVLSHYLDGGPQQMEFLYGAFGKPYLKNHGDLHFNLSHSGDQILLAVAGFEVGIDTEQHNSNFDFEPLLAECFCVAEIEYIKTSIDPTTACYTVWTRKEAILKRSGTGIAVHLPDINSLADSNTYSWEKEGYHHAVAVTEESIAFEFYRY
jgi:4'-phosphopantetheinyl transferase